MAAETGAPSPVNGPNDSANLPIVKHQLTDPEAAPEDGMASGLVESKAVEKTGVGSGLLGLDLASIESKLSGKSNKKSNHHSRKSKTRNRHPESYPSRIETNASIVTNEYAGSQRSRNNASAFTTDKDHGAR